MNLVRQVNPNGTVTEVSYDRASRLRSLVNRRLDGTVIASFAYEVNGVGLRMVMTATYGWRNPPVGVEHYAYDPLRRLIGVTDREGFQAVYEYDASGNRTRWWANDDQTTQRPGDGFEVTYTYDAADRLLEAVRVSGPPEGTQRYVYAYDANGNRINLNWPGPPGPNTQGIDYAYDREDRLILAQAYQTHHRGHRVDREVTRLFYDGLGRRLAKEYDPRDGSGGVKRTEYVFDGLDPVVEYRLWNGQRAEYYRGGLESFSPTPMLLEMLHFPAGSEGQAYWYHLDGRGSVAGLTKHQGQSTHNYRYDAYGQVLPAQGNWTDPHNHYTFLGKEWDEHLGLYEFGFRLYDPWAGVWLTREPLPGRAWEPRTWHRYQYAYASPISYYDPYGLMVIPGDGDGELSPTPPAPIPRPTPTLTTTPTGASQCTPPLSEELWRYARQAAWEFQLPPEFVAAVLWAQQRYDYTLQDVIEDALARTALRMIEAEEDMPAWAPRDPRALFQGWMILGLMEGIDLSLGVSQVRVSVARGVAEEFYGMTPSTRELIAQMENPEWNVRYMAGYLRQLANKRGTEEFTIKEMQILYGAYRVGTKKEVAPGITALKLQEPGPLGSLLSPACVEYYRQLLEK